MAGLDRTDPVLHPPQRVEDLDAVAAGHPEHVGDALAFQATDEKLGGDHRLTALIVLPAQAGMTPHAAISVMPAEAVIQDR